MTQRHDYKITLENVTDDQIAASLRAELAKRSPDPALGTQYTKGLIIGALFGAVVMAAADYGDVWLCVGDCRDQIKDALE
jgi:hypothetical protein